LGILIYRSRLCHGKGGTLAFWIVVMFGGW
jgi:hypothetical protein